MQFLRNESGLWDSAAVRLSLYFIIAAGSAFLVQTEAISAFSDWTVLQWLRTLLGSLISGLTAARAFLDQTLSKNADEPPKTP